jgi:hypothetical protein
MTEQALHILANPSSSAYARALAALRDDTRAWWQEQLGWNADDYDEDQTPYHADAESLRRFLEAEILPWYGEASPRARVSPIDSGPGIWRSRRSQPARTARPLRGSSRPKARTDARNVIQAAGITSRRRPDLNPFRRKRLFDQLIIATDCESARGRVRRGASSRSSDKKMVRPEIANRDPQGRSSTD